MPANPSVLSTVAAFFGTLLFAVSGLLMLGVALLTTFFTSKAPQGQNAMGLVVPMGMLAIASVTALIGVGIALGIGRFAGITSTTLGDWLLVGGASIGVLLAVNGSFGLWVSDHRIIVGGHRAELRVLGMAVANFGGLLAPSVFIGLLLTALWGWIDFRQTGSGFRAIAWILAAAAVQGYLSLGFLAACELLRSTQNARAAAAERAERDAEWERRRNLTPAERAQEYISHFSETGPAWHLCMSLFHEPDSAARELLIDRISRCEELESQLTSTLACEYASLRGGALDYLAARGTPSASLAESAICSLDILTVDIRESRGEKTKQLDADFDREIERTATTITRLLEALPPTERASALAALPPRIANLREALANVKDGPARERSNAAIAALETRWR